MPAKDGFQLQDADIEILHDVFRLRLATVDQIANLTGRSIRALWNRLLKLTERHYLASVARFMQKRVYAVGMEGIRVLIEHGFAPEDLADTRLRHRELTEIGIRHALFLADIHALLLRLSASGPVKLLHWAEGPSLWDKIVPSRGSAAIPIRPDAWITLAHCELPAPGNTFHVFIEADRGTMAHSRMIQKIQGYVAYHDQQRFTARYPGMKTFSVATITETRRRAQELQDALHPILPTAKSRRAYRFLPVEHLTPEALIGVKPIGPS